MIYIIHGDKKEDFNSVIEQHKLNRKDCVFVLKGFESPFLKDTDTIKHIWKEEKDERIDS